MNPEQRDIVNLLVTGISTLTSQERDAMMEKVMLQYVDSFRRERPERTDAEVVENLKALVTAVYERLQQVDASSGGASGTA